ncbi:DegT/DnrJ/EryC1/StrS family aminotransferase [Balneola sp. MJW-20]|uniref:DegT/DnrJ/EryC1/StrS family aminotransferase n=1 Tax=Gracilimonas aurantiaca TaxID=3234185 RepID=UPI003466370F
MRSIPILDLAPEIDLMRKDLDAAYHKVMDHGRFIMGPEVKEFEAHVAEYLGSKHAIGVNSGTDALVIALRAAGIGEGDEVITTSFTFFATAESISMVGAKPVFADIDEKTYNVDPDEIVKKISERTKAIMPVHLYGRPAAMSRIMEIAEKHDLLVIEDCAQSFGASYEITCLECHGKCSRTGKGQKLGSIGQLGAYSFFPSKNLGGFGDGGLIVTDDDELAELCRKLRSHGSLKKYRNEMLGYNSRLDTLQAALLDVRLNHIEAFNSHRRAVAERYTRAFADMDGIIPPTPEDAGHVYHQYTVRVTGMDRDELAQKLEEKGISTMIYYPVPSHRLPVYGSAYNHVELPITDRLTDEVLSLPIGGMFSEEDQKRVIDSVVEILSS